MVIEYEARIKELQEEIDLDDEAFKNKLIDKLKSQVGEQRQSLLNSDETQQKRHQLIHQAVSNKQSLMRSIVGKRKAVALRIELAAHGSIKLT